MGSMAIDREGFTPTSESATLRPSLHHDPVAQSVSGPEKMVSGKNQSTTPRTTTSDDSTVLYLQGIGRVSLLTREGEAEVGSQEHASARIMTVRTPTRTPARCSGTAGRHGR